MIVCLEESSMENPTWLDDLVTEQVIQIELMEMVEKPEADISAQDVISQGKNISLILSFFSTSHKNIQY